MNLVETAGLMDELTEAGKLYKQEPAVYDGDRQLSYGELYALANELAGKIQQQCSVLDGNGAPHRVGIYLSQSCGSIISLLAVLLSGNIYVPLEVNLPDQRLKDILEDAGIGLLLTNKEWQEKATTLTAGRTVQLLDIDDSRQETSDTNLPAIDGSNAAYILYTSGSTGKPKGVIQTQQNILFFASMFGNMMKVTNADRIALTTSLSHTVSVIDVFSHLLKGACIVVYDMKKEKDLSLLQQRFIADGITIFHSIPNLFRVLFGSAFSTPALLAIRLVILGGEDIRVKDFELYKKAFNDNVVMVNLYGSSELIIAFAQLLNKRSVITRERIPVGFPVKGVDYELRGETGARCGVLGVGELILKSKYLSPGYWQLPQAAAITKDPQHDGLLLYRSGDQARTLPAGNVEFMGRADSQIKINGNRIELQEIEIVLEKMNGISKSIVKTFSRGNDEQFIACFYRAEGNEDPVALRNHLQQYLPDFMIPERFIRVQEFPLTETGKIDRKGLEITLPQEQQTETDTHDYTPNQQQVAAIWREVLGHDQFKLRDKFFEIGGNSLKLIELYTTLHAFFPGQLSVQMIFENQTVQAMAAVLDSTMQQEAIVTETVEDIEF